MSRTCCCRRPRAAAPRSRHPAGPRRQPLAHRPPAAHRERAAGGHRRRGGRAAGVGRRAGVRGGASAAGALPIALDFAVDRRVLLFSLAALGGDRPRLRRSRRRSRRPARAGAGAQGRSVRARWPRAPVQSEEGAGRRRSRAVAAAPHRGGLFIRSLRAVQAIDPGFAVDQLVSAPLNVNILRYTKAQGREFYRRRSSAWSSCPGVQSASVARMAVLTGGGRVTSLRDRRARGLRRAGQSEGGGRTSAAATSRRRTSSAPGSSRRSASRSSRGRDFGADATRRQRRSSPLSTRRWRNSSSPAKTRSASASRPASPTRSGRGRRSSASCATASTRRSARRLRRSSTCHSRSGTKPGVTLYVRATGRRRRCAQIAQMQALDPTCRCPTSSR